MSRRLFLKRALVGGAAVLMASYPLFIERRWVQLNRYRIRVPQLPAGFHGYRIAQLTDIHFGALVSEAFVAGIVARTNALKPDLIACTGDYVQQRDTTAEIDRVWPLLAELRAQDGAWSVLGNHDHWADTERSLEWLDRSRQNLHHRCMPIYRGEQRVVIGGAGDLWEDELGIDDAFACSDEFDCRILLSHNPDSVDSRFDTPLHLVLSGHTHGGQVVIPGWGPPLLPVSNKRYVAGLIQTPRSQLFISRGLGWAMAPLRFNCFPEIALLELMSPDVLRLQGRV